MGKVGVCRDDVQATVAFGVGVGFIAGVNDGPSNSCFESDRAFKEVGSGADLESWNFAVNAYAYSACSGIDDACCKEG